MISKRTAIILIIAIVAILIFEIHFSFNKMGQMEENLEHTVAQITLTVDGKLVNLEGTNVQYKYTGGEKALATTLSKLNDTGYESVQNNSVGFNPCGKGSNKLTVTIPKKLIPEYDSDLTVNFGCENNESDFNNYSLIINLTTVDESSIKANIINTVYYPDENGKALHKKAEASAVINSENSKINCIIN